MNFFLGHFGERNSSGTLTFFILSRFLGRNSSEISLSGWHLVIFRAEQSKKAPCTMYIYRVSQKKHSFKIFGFGLFVVFWTPLETDLDTFGLFGRFWTLLDSFDAFGRFWTLLDAFGQFGRFWTLFDTFGCFWTVWTLLDTSVQSV